MKKLRFALIFLLLVLVATACTIPVPGGGTIKFDPPATATVTVKSKPAKKATAIKPASKSTVVPSAEELTDGPEAESEPTATTKKPSKTSKDGLPMCKNAPQSPLEDGSYDYSAELYRDFNVIVEGTQEETGVTHLIRVNPSDGKWVMMSVWMCPKSASSAEMKRLAYQFAGDKVLNWQNAGVDPVEIDVDGTVLPAGEMPATYSPKLAGKPLLKPMKLYVNGAEIEKGFSASVGAIDEWTYIKYTTLDGVTTTETFYGVKEGFVYQTIKAAWRLPGEWSEEEAFAFEP